MYYALKALKDVATKTKEVILFHSGTGKDSIALLDLIYPHFQRIVCVYMYIVKDLEHINRYIDWAKAKYPKTEWVQVPHYILSEYTKYGYMGCKAEPTQKLYMLKDINKMVKTNTSIEWSIFGFKKSDSLNRRLMLMGYRDEAIMDKTKNAYPLSRYLNKDVQAYIKARRLIQPLSYSGRGQSSGTDPTNIPFLWYCRTYFPEDFRKITNAFPDAERIMFEFDHEMKEIEADGKGSRSKE